MKLKDLLIVPLIFVSFVQSFAQDVSLEWVHGIGGPSNLDVGNAITTDAQGNVYVAGNFGDTVDFDPGTGITKLGSFTSAAGNSEGFVAKYDTDGNLLWAKQTHTTSTSGPGPYQNTYPNSIALDNQGNILLSGTCLSGTTDFDPGTGVAEFKADKAHCTFVWKLDNDGNFIWVKQLGGMGEKGALAIDKANNVYVTGYFQQTADFNPGTAVHNMTPKSAIGYDYFLCKLDSSGNFQWAIQQPGIHTTKEQKCGLVLNASGDIFLAGTFIGIAENFDPGSNRVILSSGGVETSPQTFISKWDSSGVFQWVKTFQNETDTFIRYVLGADTVKWASATGTDNSFRAIYIDDGNIIIAGLYQTFGFLRPDFDPGTGNFSFPIHVDSIYGLSKSSTGRISFNPKRAYGSYIIKLNDSGELIWAKELFDDSTRFGQVEHNCIRTDYSGNIYTAGYFTSGKIDFDPGAGIADTFYLRAVGLSGIPFILKLSRAGNFTWAKQFAGDAGLNMVNGMRIGQTGSVYTVGSYSNIMDVDPGPDTELLIPYGSSRDIFIHKMSCTDTTGNQVLKDSAICRYFYGDSIYTQSGTYTYYQLQESGCRSTITLELTIKPLEVSVNIDQNVLGTSGSYSHYQWYFNGNPIPGATDNTYTVTENGEYYVVVTDENGCTGTSEVYIVNNLAIDSHSVLNEMLIYPNPNDGLLFVKAKRPLHNAQFRLVNILGQSLITQSRLNGVDFVFDISNQPKGIFFAEIEEGGNILRVKLIKE